MNNRFLGYVNLVLSAINIALAIVTASGYHLAIGAFCLGTGLYALKQERDNG